MKIEKEYDVQELANKIKEEIEKCVDCGYRNVWINTITAQKIVDVLEAVTSWENNGIKLRNIREEALKQGCFGTYDNDDIECQCCDSKKECKKRKGRNETLCDDCLMKSCCNVDCTHEHITEQMLGDLKKCFGKSYGKRIVACGTCKYKGQCEVLTKHE